MPFRDGLDHALQALRKLESDERRRDPRLPWNVLLPVYADLGGDASLVMDVITLNISRGGIGLLSERRLPVQALIRTELPLLPNSPDVTCSVRSCHELGRWFRIGVNFVEDQNG